MFLMPEIKFEALETHEAYVQRLRALYKGHRLIGTLIVLIGCGLMIAWSRHVLGDWARLAGYGLVGFGWALYIYVIIQRTRWAKINRIKG